MKNWAVTSDITERRDGNPHTCETPMILLSRFTVDVRPGISLREREKEREREK